MAISKIVYKETAQSSPVTWMDATTATAAASDILAPKTAMLADGVMTTGTGSGGSVTEAPEKAVNFYDYDGTRLYSYTAAEAQALTALPANPSHTGLTAQGWNWTLQQIKTQLTNMGGEVHVGQMYVTTSGKTEFDITLLDPDFLSPYIGLAVNGSVTVDWGDSSSTNTLTGSSDTSNQIVGHTYSSVGSYTISVTVNSGKFTIHNSAYPGVLHTSSTTTSSAWYSSAYARTITNVRLGANVYFGNYGLYSCQSLSTITMPSTITSFGTYTFARCYNLKYITIPPEVTEFKDDLLYAAGLEYISIPYGLTTLGNAAVQSCRKLKSISFPTSLTTIGTSEFYDCASLRNFVMPSGMTAIPSSAFCGCHAMTEIVISDDVETIGADAFRAMYSITTVTIPSKVTSIGSAAFRYAYSLRELHFKSANPPTLGDANVFNNLQTVCTIYVPTGRLSAYTSAQYYPSSSTYTYVEE